MFYIAHSGDISGRATQQFRGKIFPTDVAFSGVGGGLTTPDDQHPWRRCFVFNDILIDIVALGALERAEVVARPIRFDASKQHFRAALRARRLHQAIAE
jgi:hypothetical protein